MRTWPNQLITPAAWHNCRLLPGSGGDQNRAEHRRQQRRSAIETSSYLLLESRERVANYPIYSKGQVFLGLVAARPRQVFRGLFDSEGAFGLDSNSRASYRPAFQRISLFCT